MGGLAASQLCALANHAALLRPLVFFLSRRNFYRCLGLHATRRNQRRVDPRSPGISERQLLVASFSLRVFIRPQGWTRKPLDKPALQEQLLLANTMWKRQRRTSLQSAPFPPGWSRILEVQCPFYLRLYETQTPSPQVEVFRSRAAKSASRSAPSNRFRFRFRRP